MRKSSGSLRNSGTYTSPGTPEYEGGNMGDFPKGWSSERVPPPANGSRRHVNSPALMPFYSGRSFPSKWDDAERWITSPVSAFGVYKNSVVQSRRPKSKSGPLGTPGLMYLPNYSPPMVALEAGSARTFGTNSPFPTGVFMADGIQLQYGASAGDRSSRIMSDVLSESSVPSSQDGKNIGANETENMVSRVVSRRDMATQMSPDGSNHSSPGRKTLGSTVPRSVSSAKDQQHDRSSKDDIRDVQVDKGTNANMQLKKSRHRKTKRNTSDAQTPAPVWDVTQAAKDTSKLQREEAKIAAWENLQKAKAEAAVRKLEMKLEKRRSESMDKIVNRLRVAEIKAQDMRSSITESRATQRTTNNAGFGRKYITMSRLSACFSCCT
ncbi:hypothetical protein LIER_30588 [Lithospermum erythrorhizon]|uniref:Remorin C-terminal domain-containing protein n=1 Tax=Lithospermum erythrorhizon TaxID=34254 RepID=A0AAV3RTZ9_LITER